MANSNEKEKIGEKLNSSAAKINQFIKPCLLLLIKENPTYGYNLIDKLEQFGYKSPNPGLIYKNLRRLEKQELIESDWEIQVSGSPKRNYQLTKKGEKHLTNWVDKIKKNKELINHFLNKFNSID